MKMAPWEVQCVAACCSVFARCGSMAQCVAMCCRFLVGQAVGVDGDYFESCTVFAMCCSMA